MIHLHNWNWTEWFYAYFEIAPDEAEKVLIPWAWRKTIVGQRVCKKCNYHQFKFTGSKK